MSKTGLIKNENTVEPDLECNLVEQNCINERSSEKNIETEDNTERQIKIESEANQDIIDTNISVILLAQKSSILSLHIAIVLSILI